MPHRGLMLDSTETHCLRAVIQDGRVVLQTLTVSQEVALTPAQLQMVQQWVWARTICDPVLEELARVEALTKGTYA
jgi:hypothetical protein